MALLVILALLGATVALLAGPLRRGGTSQGSAEPGAGGPLGSQPAAELEAAKEAKYREIRETELDYATGKLSEQDFRATDRTLRAEAAELLGRLDALGRTPASGPPGDQPRSRPADGAAGEGR